MTEPIIRPATEADLPAVREIAELAWTPVYDEFRRRLGDELFDLTRPRGVKAKPDQVEEGFRRDPGCMLVTEVEGRVVAFVTFYVVDAEAGIGEIGNNAVHPDCQGRGHGKAQYLRIFDELRQRGCRYVRVSTGLDDSHAPARRAYEAAGFDRDLPSITYYREL
jgi:ribosomal protein S18 acetylase RimI-like enzyme